MHVSVTDSFRDAHEHCNMMMDIITCRHWLGTKHVDVYLSNTVSLEQKVGIENTENYTEQFFNTYWKSLFT